MILGTWGSRTGDSQWSGDDCSAGHMGVGHRHVLYFPLPLVAKQEKFAFRWQRHNYLYYPALVLCPPPPVYCNKV